MTIARVRQLIALACSTEHEEEARTAAMAAVRMIQKLKLRLVEPIDSAAPPPAPRPQPSRPPPPDPPRPYPPYPGEYGDDDFGSISYGFRPRPRGRSPDRAREPSGNTYQDFRQAAHEHASRVARESAGEREQRFREAINSIFGRSNAPKQQPAPEPPKPEPPGSGAWGKFGRSVSCKLCGTSIPSGTRCYAVPRDGNTFDAYCDGH